MDLQDRLADLTLALPPGRIVEVGGEPAFWLTDDATPTGLWSLLRIRHESSGLWPVLVVQDAPWWTRSGTPEDAGYVDQHDPDEFMTDTWDDWVERTEDFDLLAPFGEHCPGLTAAGEPERDPDAVADWYAGILEADGPRLALVPVERGADAPTVMGWEGAASHADTVPLSAFLRSWEERFGVRVVRVGEFGMNLAVAAPPVAEEHAVHVAAEHWVFCPDNVEKNSDSLVGYGKQIQEKIAWTFSWI